MKFISHRVFYGIATLVASLTLAAIVFTVTQSTNRAVVTPSPKQRLAVDAIQPVEPFVLAQKSNNSATLIAMGDIMLSRHVASIIKAKKDNFYPFKELTSFIPQGDIVFANLEAPITKGRVIKSGEMMFRVDPGLEQSIKKAGVTILSLANNHSMNFGAKGIVDTIKYLNDAGLQSVGAGSDDAVAYAPTYVETNGLRVAFLAYNAPEVVPVSYKAAPKHPGTAFMDIGRLKKGIAQAKPNADLVIVSMHAGTEYTQKPNAAQIAFAHTAIDNGADMVIGHHPHVVQQAEIYRGKYIFYSLGNFVFDQMFSQQTREGLVLKIALSKDGADLVQLLPVVIYDYSQPRFIDDKTGETIVNRTGLPLIKKSEKDKPTVWEVSQPTRE